MRVSISALLKISMAQLSQLRHTFRWLFLSPDQELLQLFQKPLWRECHFIFRQTLAKVSQSLRLVGRWLLTLWTKIQFHCDLREGYRLPKTVIDSNFTAYVMPSLSAC